MLAAVEATAFAVAAFAPIRGVPFPRAVVRGLAVGVLLGTPRWVAQADVAAHPGEAGGALLVLFLLGLSTPAWAPLPADRGGVETPLRAGVIGVLIAVGASVPETPTAAWALPLLAAVAGALLRSTAPRRPVAWALLGIVALGGLVLAQDVVAAFRARTAAAAFTAGALAAFLARGPADARPAPWWVGGAGVLAGLLPAFALA